MKKTLLLAISAFLLLASVACRSAKPVKLILLPDTQTYAKSYPEIFKAQTEWIAKNAREYTFVLHQGDITDYNDEKQWAIAAEAMGVLDGKIPYAFVAGNHDMGSRPRVFSDVRNTDLLNKYFPYAKYSKMPGFGGAFEMGKMDNTWHTFKKGKHKWLVLCLEFGPRNNVLDWAAKVIEEHPDSKVIINTHAYLYSDDKRMGEGHKWRPQAFGIGKLTGSESANDGEQMWEKLVSRYPNIMLVFCGHVLYDGTGMLVSKGRNGNSVYQMLANYQEGVINTEKGGNGFLRMVTIDPAGKKIGVQTYSPYLDTYKTEADQAFEFTGVDFNIPPVITPVVPAGIDSEIEAFMTKFNVPGLAMAISKDGKMLYSKGYGYADTVTKEKTSAFSLFRIASISKPLTAVAILKLAEEGKLNLDDKVFGTGALLGTTYGKQPYGPDIQDITIRALLQHASGGWQNDSSDPMFSNPRLKADELISWTLDHQPLKTKPGTNYAYSNFGYCVLGRVIEKLTGRQYEEYVRTSVLKEMGIQGMRVGGNKLADRKPQEVIYYPQQNDNPYKWDVERMDAHGGWIASAEDLVKLMMHIDGFDTEPDFLNASSMSELVKRMLPSSNYACGLRILKDGTWMHSGSLPGTGSEFMRFPNGYCAAILTNSNARGDFFKELDILLRDIVKKAATE